MADLKISEMTSASQINNDDNVELSQGNAQSGFASVKATILAIAQKIITGINFTSALETEDKTIAGAINEVASGGGGSSTFAGLSDVDIDDTTLANGQVPKWNSTTEKWENGNAGGGSGGHNIIDSDGNEMTARSGLQFENAYVSDDSVDDKTVVPIYREMTRQEYSQAQDKTGLIVVTDDKSKVVNADSVYPVETSISEHAYSEGDHLIVDGVTYIAIDDIAIGDSLVEGTNIEAETLATRMNHIEQEIYDVSDDTVGRTFTITPTTGTTFAPLSTFVNKHFAKITASVGFATELVNVGDSATLGSISDTSVLDKIPENGAVRTFTFYGTDILAVFIQKNGTILVRLLSGNVRTSTITFNIVF